MRILLIFAFILLLLAACRQNTRHLKYSHDADNCYQRLISFENTTDTVDNGSLVQVLASFSTQDDSVFWDSHNNLNDQYFFRNSGDHIDFLSRYISKAAVGDSMEILVPAPLFYSTVFGSEQVAYFSEGDSVVKVHLRILKEAGDDEMTDGPVLNGSAEFLMIENWFRNVAEFELARDPGGFYWISGRPEQLPQDTPRIGDKLHLRYQGFFLNGRPLDASPVELEFVYGSPDQVLPGLNIVIGKMGQGRSAKIILPSRLAFGQSGSSNGVVPPGTPLLYELSLAGAH